MGSRRVGEKGSIRWCHTAWCPHKHVWDGCPLRTRRHWTQVQPWKRQRPRRIRRIVRKSSSVFRAQQILRLLLTPTHTPCHNQTTMVIVAPETPKVTEQPRGRVGPERVVDPNARFLTSGPVRAAQEAERDTAQVMGRPVNPSDGFLASHRAAHQAAARLGPKPPPAGAANMGPACRHGHPGASLTYMHQDKFEKFIATPIRSDRVPASMPFLAGIAPLKEGVSQETERSLKETVEEVKDGQDDGVQGGEDITSFSDSLSSMRDGVDPSLVLATMGIAIALTAVLAR